MANSNFEEFGKTKFQKTRAILIIGIYFRKRLAELKVKLANWKLGFQFDIE